MNVIVKGMKMPDCCGECELNDSDDDGIYCIVLEVFMRFDELPKGRRSDCPLAELIRCKDCKKYGTDGNRLNCNVFCCSMPENGFCSMGERKEG